MESLPHNSDAEMALLCSITLKPEILDELPRDFTTEMLYIPALYHIFDALRTVRERDKMIDFVAVKEELRRNGLLQEVGGLEGLSQVFGFVPAPDNWKFYYDLIDECWTRRRLILACQGLIDRARSLDLGDDPKGVLRDFIEREIMILARGGRDQEFRLFKELLHQVLDEIEERSKSKGIVNVRFGLSKLDSVLGGLEPGDLAIICAETSFGKSILGMQAVTVGAAKGIGAGVFSFEMPPNQMVERILSAETEVPMSSLRTGLLTELEYPKLATSVLRIMNYPIWVVGCYGLDLPGICSSARYLKTKHDIGLMVIDYLQLVPVAPGRRRDSSREREVAEISRTLKLLAGELKVAIIGCSQVNDEGKLRESRAIGQDADVILKIGEPRDDEDVFHREISVLKHRHGPRGAKVRVNFFGQYMKFTDI
jgi:replicative DNA helicase